MNAQRRKVVMIGDSLAVGLRKHIQALAQRDGTELVYRAKGGTVTGQWARGQNPETRVPELDGASHFVVVLGTNDSGYQGDAFPGHMETLIGKADAALVPVTWAEPTGHHLRDYDKVRAALDAAVQSRGIQQIVPHPELSPYGDRIHFDDKANAQWAEAIWNALAELDNPPGPTPKPPVNPPRTDLAVLSLAAGFTIAALTAIPLIRS